MAHRPNTTPAADIARDMLSVLAARGDDAVVTDDDLIERGWSRADLIAHGPEARQIARKRLSRPLDRRSPRFGVLQGGAA